MSKQLSKIIEDWSALLNATELENRDDLKIIGEFISKEFAKKDIQNDHDYKISAAISDLIFHSGNAPAIIYPSVRADYLGTNIALRGDRINEYLELKQVGIFKASINHGKGELIPIAITQDLGQENSNFKWNFL